jgi:hypothetical protein
MINIKNTFRLFFVLLLGLTVSSCDTTDPEPEKDAETPLSSAKEIESFEFIIEGETYNAILTDNEIAVEVPFGTDVSAASTDIVVPDEATIVPASGETVDLTQSVTYTVTAEDSSTIQYEVILTNSVVPISLEPIQGFPLSGPATVQRRSYILVLGENFIVGSSSVELVHEGEALEMDIIIEQEDRIGFTINEETPLGENTLLVKSGGDVAEYPEKLIVDFASPAIEGFSPAEVVIGGTFDITGNYFATETENQVSLSGDSEIMLEVLSATKTSLSVKVPSEVVAGEYTVSVTSNGYQVFYNTEKIKVINDPDTPIITEFDNTSYKKGETITITGENLGKEGVVSEIIFTRFTRGSDQTVIAEVNAEGTTLTYLIPDSFDTGTYSVAVRVGELTSEEYGEIINIEN